MQVSFISQNCKVWQTSRLHNKHKRRGSFNLQSLYALSLKFLILDLLTVMLNRFDSLNKFAFTSTYICLKLVRFELLNRSHHTYHSFSLFGFQVHWLIWCCFSRTVESVGSWKLKDNLVVWLLVLRRLFLYFLRLNFLLLTVLTQ